MATYTTDTTITSNLNNGENLVIAGVKTTVTIDASVFIPTMTYGKIQATNFGTFLFKNKTNNILPITFSSNNNDIQIEGVSTLKLDGDLIEIATGDGTAGQTIDFSSIGDNGVSIDFPNAVWVEETPGGAKRPFINLGDNSADDYAPTLSGDGIGKDNYGGVGASLETGMYFEYDRSTQTATFGDGTNGHVIPNGCKVFFPNIVIDSTWVSTLSSRTTFDFNSNGTLETLGVQLSEALYLNLSGAKVVKMQKTSLSDFLNILDCNGTLYIKDVAMRKASRGQRVATNNDFNVKDMQTDDVSVEDVYLSSWIDTGSSTSARGASSFFFDTGGTFNNLHFHLVDKRNNTHTAIHYPVSFRVVNAEVNNIYTIGGMLNLQATSDSTIKDIYYGGSIFNPVSGADHGAKYRNIGYQISGNNTKIINWSLLDDTLVPTLCGRPNGLTSSGIEMYNHNYTYTKTWGLGNPDSAFEVTADNCIIKNCVIDSTSHVRGIEQVVDAVNLVADNVIVKGNQQTNQIRKGATWNMVGQRFNSTAVASPAQDIGIYLGVNNQTGSAVTDGQIHILFTPPLNNSYHYVLGENSYFNNTSRVYLYGGESVEIGAKNPLLGFTGFRDDVYYENGSLEFDEIDGYVEMVNGDEDFTGTYTAFDTSTNNWYSGLNTIFNGLTGYDSNVGLKIRFKFTRNETDANYKDIVAYSIPCTVDNTYVSKEGKITFEGGDSTEKYEIIKDSDDSVLYTFIGTGTHDFAVGSNLDEEVYFKRYKYVDSTYVLLVTTKYTTQKLVLGDNGKVLLYTGNEVQVASTDVESIWSYDTRTTTEGFTSSDRTQLNKGLTTGKFLALK